MTETYLVVGFILGLIALWIVVDEPSLYIYYRGEKGLPEYPLWLTCALLLIVCTLLWLPILLYVAFILIWDYDGERS